MARQHLSTPAQEGSTYFISITHKDEGGTIQTPTSIHWSLSNTDGTIIGELTNVNVPGGDIGEAPTPTSIKLSGDDLEIIGVAGTEDEAIRIFTVKSVYGGNTSYQSVTFAIEQVRIIL